MTVLSNGHLGNLYFGKRIHDREDFSYLLEMKQRPMTACVYEGNRKFSLEHLKLEYPVGRRLLGLKFKASRYR